MSFLKIEDHNKRDEIVKEFLALKNKIKDNFRKERIGEIETQRDLAKLFKPVTETQIATTKELQEGLKPIKEGIESIPRGIAFPAYPSIELPKEGVLELGPNAVSALKRFLTKEGVDIDLYNPVDHENYKRILIQTDAMQSKKNPNRPKSNKGSKWKKVIKNIWHNRGGYGGEGVTVIPSDPNALLERLDLLLASQAAGHTGVGNELTSICDELKRQGVISTDAYKKINSLIKI